tara:strand:+ start:1249 stop:1536 length:288 start_codon:yes stop_codon:yes gene_type:complete
MHTVKRDKGYRLVKSSLVSPGGARNNFTILSRSSRDEGDGLGSIVLSSSSLQTSEYQGEDVFELSVIPDLASQHGSALFDFVSGHLGSKPNQLIE